jgi:hypothetical protein
LAQAAAPTAATRIEASRIARRVGESGMGASFVFSF